MDELQSWLAVWWRQAQEIGWPVELLILAACCCCAAALISGGRRRA